MPSNLIPSLKSTLDKTVNDIAVGLGIPFVDLDDPINAKKSLEGSEHCLIWKFGTMVPDPQHPLYSLEFDVGVKTTYDPSNYTLLTYLAEVQNVFIAGQFITIMDYTQAVAGTADEGSIFVVQSSVNEQMVDEVSGARTVTITARVQAAI